MRVYHILIILSLLNLISCTSYKGLLPSYVRENALKIHLRSAQRRFFCHKIKTDGFGEAKVYNSFTKSRSAMKNRFAKDFAFENMFHCIADSFGKKNANPNSRFRLDFDYQNQHCLSFCADRRAPNPSLIKKLHSEIGIYQEYRFETFIYAGWSNANNPWHLSFAGFTDTKNKDKYFSDIHRPDGTLTDKATTINLRRASLRDVKRSFSWRTQPIHEMTGYKFMLDGKILGFIDLADQDIWIKKDVDDQLKMILVSAAICMFIRNQIS